jgi:NAD(P)-dependent dehydrogenase (short-subunit alcohol dehydrogenase family)
MTRVVSGDKWWNVTAPAFGAPAVARHATRSSGCCSVISASHSRRAPPMVATQCKCPSSICCTDSTPSMKRGNSSNCVHWSYAVRTGTRTSMDSSIVLMCCSPWTSSVLLCIPGIGRGRLSGVTTPDQDLFDLSGKVAVVTGGSRGLGREMCLAFARHGASVVIASRKADACIALADDITASTGAKALGVGCHVGRWSDCDDLVKTTNDTFGHIDVLVNNAGGSPLYPSLSAISEELWDKTIALNLKGPFRLCALVAEQMAEGDGGSIINVSSVAAVQPSAVEVPYATAKAGLNCLTVALAHAFGPKVRVNTIMPGPFMTDISKAWDLEVFHERARTQIPLGRGGEPDEVVGAALYLASKASSYTTGAIIKIDGGAAFAPA